MAQSIRSLLEVPGLEALAPICDYFRVSFTAHGGLVRRYVLYGTHPAPRRDLDLFALAPAQSDIDVLHDGPAKLTPAIHEAVASDVPLAECFRWEVRSERESALFSRAAPTSGIVPVNLMQLSTDERIGLVDPWQGMTDIVTHRYRYVRNGFYSRSPWYRAGRDLEVFSVLLYAKALLEAGLGFDEKSEGSRDALRVVEDAARSPEVAVRLQESAYLRARLLYLLKSVASASHSAARYGKLLRALRLEPLLQQLSHRVPALGGPLAALVTIGDSVLVTSARIGGDTFRLPHTSSPWLDGANASESLDRALRASRQSDEQPVPGLGPGQELRLASPALPLSPGASRSSAVAGTLSHEFIHFMIPRKQGMKCDETDLTVILSLTETGEGGTAESTILSVPTVCTFGWRGDAAESGGMLLNVRANCGAIFDHAWSGEPAGAWEKPVRLQAFVLQWTGGTEQPALRRQRKKVQIHIARPAPVQPSTITAEAVAVPSSAR